MSLLAPSHPVRATVRQSVDFCPVSSEYTFAQAAEFLNMSERHLNDLLNAGYITFRQENGERLVQLDSMLEYEREIERGHAACDELLGMFQEMGLTG